MRLLDDELMTLKLSGRVFIWTVFEGDDIFL